MYTWGTGSYGELGIQTIKNSNNPLLIGSIKKFFIYKLQCGHNYTAGVDCMINK